MSWLTSSLIFDSGAVGSFPPLEPTGRQPVAVCYALRGMATRTVTPSANISRAAGNLAMQARHPC
jgi:hypothetical protein